MGRETIKSAHNDIVKAYGKRRHVQMDKSIDNEQIKMVVQKENELGVRIRPRKKGVPIVVTPHDRFFDAILPSPSDSPESAMARSPVILSWQTIRRCPLDSAAMVALGKV